MHCWNYSMNNQKKSTKNEYKMHLKNENKVKKLKNK